MSQVVQVDLGERSYDIHIGTGLLAGLGSLSADSISAGRGLVVSDSNVEPLYGAACANSLSEAGYTVESYTVPAGEASKSEERLFAIYDAALEAGLDRKGFIAALGGGVVGDLAGYAAASYLRGVSLVQVPTSLLAMVDSAVGGKTGINLPQGKNLIGAFHQPALVVADLDTLGTLPRREYVAGLAEVVKYGVIHDAELFARLEENVAAVLDGDPALMASIVARCCEVKAEVVRQDEREGGLRAILNFGHTIGHAIEQAAGYGHYLHGEAISIGMHFAGHLSVQETDMPAGDLDRLLALLEKLGLPLRASGLAWDDLVKAIQVDKKTVGRAPRFVLAEALGRVRFGCEVNPEILAETWHVCSE